MRRAAECALRSLKGRMRSFLQVGPIDDEGLYARELRGLRLQVTRTIVELEKGDGEARVVAGGGVSGVGGGVVAESAGPDAGVAEVKG